MGNCAPKPRTTARSKPPPPSSTVRLYGSESCPITARMRLALLYKSVPVELLPSEIPSPGRPFIRVGSDTISGPVDSLLRFIDSAFPAGPTAAAEWGRGSSEVEAVVRMQHRCIERHVEGMAGWARDLVAAGGGAGERKEARRIGEWYGRLVEVMLEHAQMEERFLFPALDKAAGDPDLCKKATEQHGREFPMMNGIKEDIKTLAAMEPGSPFYDEALLSLSLRLKTFQEHCRDHFAEEERTLLPLVDTAEKSGRDREEKPWVEEVMGLMEATHSAHLFPFFVAGLLPNEAMRYVDLVCRYSCGDNDQQQRAAAMLRAAANWLEGTAPLSWIGTAPFRKAC